MTIDHLYSWEYHKGKQYEWGESEERMERNARLVERLVCRCDGCGRMCRSKAGLTKHEKRMHRVAEERVRFACSICWMNVETEGPRKNHERTCTGGEIGRDGRRECGRCGAWITYGKHARHVRGCARTEGERNNRGVSGSCERERYM